MQKIEEGQVVVATAGRDKGEYFIVLQTDDTYCYLVDGKRRRVENPKKKKFKHLKPTPACFEEINMKLANGGIVGNGEIRKCLKLYRDIESEV